MVDATSKPKVALVALGGNALLQRGEEPTSENQVSLSNLPKPLNRGPVYLLVQKTCQVAA